MRLSTYWTLLKTFSWQELRLHPWRHAMAVLAVMLGVGLALSVQLINASALSEFSAASQSASGEPDAQLLEFAQRTGLSMGQWLTIPLFVAGLVLVIRALIRPELGTSAPPPAA